MIVTLPPDNLKITLPDLHCMIIGPPNSGKSHLASSAETPMLVCAADPISKIQTYMDRGIPDEDESGKLKQYQGAQGQPVWIIRSPKTGKAIIQIEGYYDEDDRNPVAMQQFIDRLPQIAQEVKSGGWRTVVVDSWTQFEWIAKIRRSYGPYSSGVDSVYLAAKDDLENVVKARLMNLRCNLIIIFHIETKVIKDRKGQVVQDARVDAGGGDMTYSIQAIGALKNIGNVLGECYLAVAPIDGSDNYTLQTRKDADFRTLESRIKAPNPCKNDWRELFGPWIKQAAEKKRAMLQVQAANGAAASIAQPEEATAASK